MAKKREQTTGLPKAPRRQDQAVDEEPKSFLERVMPQPLDEMKTRAEREAEVQRRIYLGIGLATAFVIIIIAGALLRTEVLQPRQTVASIEGDGVTVREFQDRVRFERVLISERISAQINELIETTGLPFEQVANQVVQTEPYATLWQEINSSDVLGLRVLNDMADDAIVRQEAEERGITVTQEDIEEELAAVFNFDDDLAEIELAAEGTPEVTAEPTITPTPSPTPFVSPTPSPEPSATPTFEVEPTPTLTPFPTVEPPPTLSPAERGESYEDTLDDFYDIASDEAGFSREEVNDYFELQALRAALGAQVAAADTTETWVNARHILVETEEEALDVIQALEAGESFAALARAVSTDTGSGANGGELGWAPASNFVAPFGDATRNTPIGVITEPVQSEFGFHVIQVRAREERDVDETVIENNQEQALATWLEERRDSEQYEIDFGDNWPDFTPDTPGWRYREL